MPTFFSKVFVNSDITKAVFNPSRCSSACFQTPEKDLDWGKDQVKPSNLHYITAYIAVEKTTLASQASQLVGAGAHKCKCPLIVKVFCYSGFLNVL